MTDKNQSVEYGFDGVKITGPELSNPITRKEMDALVGLMKSLLATHEYEFLSGLLIAKGCSPKLAAMILAKAGGERAYAPGSMPEPEPEPEEDTGFDYRM